MARRSTYGPIYIYMEGNWLKFICTVQSDHHNICSRQNTASYLFCHHLSLGVGRVCGQLCLGACAVQSTWLNGKLSFIRKTPLKAPATAPPQSRQHGCHRPARGGERAIGGKGRLGPRHICSQPCPLQPPATTGKSSTPTPPDSPQKKCKNHDERCQSKQQISVFAKNKWRK